MTLSKEEAVHFLRDVLRVPHSVSSKQPSISFLNEIVKSYQNAIPWQSVTSGALLPSQRHHLPAWEEKKRNQFAKKGGMCYENNMFMKELLYAFDFDVCYTSAQVMKPYDHMTITVHGLTGSLSRHLVDVGNTYPLFRAIPLDFEAESIEHDTGFLRQRFVKTSSGVIKWHHEKPHASWEGFEFEENNEGWYQFAEIKASLPCDVNVFETRMTDVYTVEEGNQLLQIPRAVVYNKTRLIAVKGKQLFVETTDKTIERKNMENLDQLLQTYKTHFPQIPANIVQDALNLTIFNVKRMAMYNT